MSVFAFNEEKSSKCRSMRLWIVTFVVCFVVANLFMSYDIHYYLSRNTSTYLQSKKSQEIQEIEKPHSLRCGSCNEADNHTEKSITNTSSTKINGTKKILYYTGFFNIPDWQIGFGPDVFSNCPVSDCIVTNDRSFAGDPQGSVSGFDAVLFHLENFLIRVPPSRFIRNRRPEQRFVAFDLEPPPMIQMRKFNLLRNFFNWTMTYRSDSDIYSRYGYFVPNKGVQQDIPYVPQDFTVNSLPSEIRSASSRSNLVLWLVSRCRSPGKREEYVEELRKYIQVDIKGICGQFDCPHNSNCSENVMGQYKFYLAFENAYCHDYVTEKFFKALNQTTVPVVMGLANYSTIALAHSYIDVRDFKSPKDLALFLLRLDKNHTEYLSYFWWKRHYTVVPNYGWRDAMCTLCEKLHTDFEPRVYEDIGDWLFNYHKERPSKGLVPTWRDRRRPVCVGKREFFTNATHTQ